MTFFDKDWFPKKSTSHPGAIIFVIAEKKKIEAPPPILLMFMSLKLFKAHESS